MEPRHASVQEPPSMPSWASIGVFCTYRIGRPSAILRREIPGLVMDPQVSSVRFRPYTGSVGGPPTLRMTMLRVRPLSLRPSGLVESRPLLMGLELRLLPAEVVGFSRPGMMRTMVTGEARQRWCALSTRSCRMECRLARPCVVGLLVTTADQGEGGDGLLTRRATEEEPTKQVLI